MVTQPTYLSNLKNYAREKTGSDSEAEELIADFSAESDRGAIILASTSIEDMLEHRLLLQMRNLHDDGQARKRMFEQDGQLATFSGKIELAYALGFLDRPYRKHINLIREIRNACAHSRKPLSLKKLVLRTACEAVIWDMLPDLKDREPLTIRIAFVTKCALISHYVGTGEKLEGSEAQIRFLARMKRAPSP